MTPIVYPLFVLGDIDHHDQVVARVTDLPAQLANHQVIFELT
jgi:hypothetical protein